MTSDIYTTQFSTELEASRSFLRDLRDAHPAKHSEFYAHAADAYGDARKILEEFETDFLRGRLKGSLPEADYLEIRSRMIGELSEIHTQLLETRRTLNHKPQETPA